MRRSPLVLLAIWALFGHCRKSGEPEQPLFALRVPVGFPAPEIPADNALTAERVELGRRLFYDPILSADSSRSCASCHAAHLAFSDSTAVSLGVMGRAGQRNAPSLANVAYQKKLMREGGAPSLEMQVLAPIQAHDELDFDIVLAAERLKNQPFYVDLIERAYGRAPDPFSIVRGIAAFERTLLSGSSRFDAWFFQRKKWALTPAEQRGHALFRSAKTGCTGCHDGFLFTDQGFEDNGLCADCPADPGRFRLTGLETDRGRFKTPSLRNLGLTAPYMHDGSLPTLEAVLAHYESGGQPSPNKSPLIRPFSLTASERADLLAFLRSLDDAAFARDPAFKKPD